MHIITVLFKTDNKVSHVVRPLNDYLKSNNLSKISSFFKKNHSQCLKKYLVLNPTYLQTTRHHFILKQRYISFKRKRKKTIIFLQTMELFITLIESPHPQL